ncbi:MAG: TetR/AcrR family transcriptional regulator [Anaerolineae bacterium]|nr:TetR/AcrR family transcriptional regulator [Anaerolineae bacterium]
MPTRKQEDSATKAHILKQAERLFAKRGYSGVSMREIAQAAQMTKANLYYYFRDKESLYVQVLEQDMIALIEALEQASQQGHTCHEKILRMTETFMSLVHSKNTLIQMTVRHFGGLEREIRGLVRRYRVQLMQPIERVLKEGVRRRELRALNTRLAALSLFGMMSIFLAPHLLELPLDEAESEIVPHTVELFMNGARAR